MIRIRPYFTAGRSQVRIGIHYRKPLDNWWQERYLYVGLTWQLRNKHR